MKRRNLNLDEKKIIISYKEYINYQKDIEESHKRVNDIYCKINKIHDELNNKVSVLIKKTYVYDDVLRYEIISTTEAFNKFISKLSLKEFKKLKYGAKK